MTNITIFQPRWHDRKVLIACHKVGINNEIVFTKAPTLPGVYTIKGSEVEKCPKESNGTITCYAVPIDLLRRRDDTITDRPMVEHGTTNNNGSKEPVIKAQIQPKLF